MLIHGSGEINDSLLCLFLVALSFSVNDLLVKVASFFAQLIHPQYRMQQHVGANRTVLLFRPFSRIVTDAVLAGNENHGRGTMHVGTDTVVSSSTGQVQRSALVAVSEYSCCTRLDAPDSLPVEADGIAGKVLVHRDGDFREMIACFPHRGYLSTGGLDHLDHFTQQVI